MNFGYFRFLGSLRGIEPRRGLFRNTRGELSFLTDESFGVFVADYAAFSESLRESGICPRRFLKGLHFDGLLAASRKGGRK